MCRTNVRFMSKKELILDTTLKLIAENGLNASPMSLIVKTSGVSTGTIYHHFKSKEEIINQIYLNKKKDFKNILEQNRNKKLNFKKEFKSIWLDFYRYFSENPLIYSFTQQISFSPIITDEVKREGEQFYQYIFEFFQKGIDKNKIIDMDLKLIVQLVLSNILSLVDLKMNGVIITNKMLQDAIKYSWRGIKK